MNVCLSIFFCIFFLFSFFFFYSLWWNRCVCMLCECCIYVINRQSVNNTYCTTKCCSFPFFVMIGGRENEKDSMQIFKRWFKHSTYQHFYLLYVYAYMHIQYVMLLHSVLRKENAANNSHPNYHIVSFSSSSSASQQVDFVFMSYQRKYVLYIVECSVYHP